MIDTKVAGVRPQQDHPHGSLLTLIKLLHTVVWAFFVVCIFALPLAGLSGRYDWVFALTALVLLECVIIMSNRGSCPLTNLAGRLTTERADNFDIYLPLWLARHNKTIFGSLFIAGELFVLGCRLNGWKWK